MKKRELRTKPPGSAPSVKARLLETGADLLQGTAPRAATTSRSAMGTRR